MIGKNLLWVAKQHGHSVDDVERVCSMDEEARDGDIQAIKRAMNGSPTFLTKRSVIGARRVRECLIARAHEIKDKGCLGALHWCCCQIDLRCRRRLAEVLPVNRPGIERRRSAMPEPAADRLAPATLGAVDSGGENIGVSGEPGCGGQVPVRDAVYTPAGDPRKNNSGRAAPGPCPAAPEWTYAAADSRSCRSTAELGWHQHVQDRPDFCARCHRRGAKLEVSVLGTRTCAERSRARDQRRATSEARY